MNLIISNILVLTILEFVYSTNLSGYTKSYKDFKVYDVKGDKSALVDFYEFLKKYEETGDMNLKFQGQLKGLSVMMSPDLQNIFEAAVKERHLNADLIEDDFSKVINEEKVAFKRAKEFGWTAYYDVDDIYVYLTNVSKTNPNSTELIVGGKTYEGRDILGLRIVTPAKNHFMKPAMFIESGIHAREWITPATTTYFINQLLTSSDPDIMSLRERFDWHIFPTVNPDGYHYSYNVDRMWRKTRSQSASGCFGADPNRNWDYNWNTAGSSSNSCNYQTYAGSKPFSEIETRTLSEYIASVENLLGYFAFHADAQMLLVPFSDSKEHRDNFDDLIKIGIKSLEYGYEVNQEEYDGPATAAEILYEVSGGSMDWVKSALGTPLVYTYELRGYYFTWPPSRIPEQGDEYTQMLLGLLTEAKDLGYF